MDQKNLVKVPAQGELFPYPYGTASLYTDADNVGIPPTLESLPTELQLQICREMLRSKEPIILCLCDLCYPKFAFGSLGILRASKHFSTMALSVMYGENCFHLVPMHWVIENKISKNDHSEDDDLEDDDSEDDDFEDDDSEYDDPEDDDFGNHCRGTVSVLLVLKRMLVDF